MMKKKILVYTGIILIFWACGSSKNQPTEAQLQALNELMDSRQFTIESDWAYPQATRAMQQIANSGLLMPGNTAGNISLVGNTNFLKIKGDSIFSYLPYFGERQMQVDYGGRDNAIEFKGLMEDLTIEKTKNNGYKFVFNAKSGRENFRVYLTITPGLKSDLLLNSGSRFPIGYSGNAKNTE
ncbi:DUF4251 domain-containing protein [Flavobacteriaceae bacterium SZ-1-7]|uniref:DUF4251 domain-containing protein n=1 Tax=Tamlana sedimenti TaxID=3134126 RepID=UPI0031298121